MMRRIATNLCAAAVLAFVAVGCSSETKTTTPTSTLALTTTRATATTIAASTTTTPSTPAAVTSSVLTPGASTTRPSTAVSSTSAAPATIAPATTANGPTATSSNPPVTNGAALVLRDNSLGNAAFGADPDTVIAIVTGVIGPPTLDSGWMDPLSLGSCPGTEVRTVTWGDLVLLFSDESRVVSGRPHLFAYTYGPAAAGAVEPGGLQTDVGVGIGTTVAQLRLAYPNVAITAADATAPAGFEASPALTGLLTSDQDTGVVTEVSGGFGCGE